MAPRAIVPTSSGVNGNRVNTAGTNQVLLEKGIAMPAARSAAPAMLLEFWLIGE